MLPCVVSSGRDTDAFRRRLMDAVERVGRKTAYLGAEISEGGLSRIVNGHIENPGIFTVKAIADAAGVTLGELLGEEGFNLTSDDREFLAHLREWIDTKLPIETRTLPRWTIEFPVAPADFIERDFDYPIELHAEEVEVYDVAAGKTGINAEVDVADGFLLHGKDVRDASHRVIKVDGDSMSPTFEAGWKLLVDVKKLSPIEDDVVAVYMKHGGSVIGRWEMTTKGARLLKDNESHAPVELGDPSGWRLIGIVQKIVDAPVARRRKG